MIRFARVAPLVAAALAGGSQLAAQAVAVRAVIAAPKNSARLSGVTERADGVWAGAALDLRAGSWALFARGLRGQLETSQPGFVPTSDVGEIAVSGRYDVRPWIGIDLGYTTRAFRSAAGYQRWEMVGVGATATSDLGTPAVRANISLTYIPVVSLRTQEDPTSGLGSEVAIAAAPPRLPIVIALSYRIERFHFPSVTGRSEQFESLAFSVGVKAWREDGRWRFTEGR